MAEWSNAAVLKTVEGHTSGGSNPSFSAKETHNESCGFFNFKPLKIYFHRVAELKNQQATACVGLHACPGLPFGMHEHSE